MARKKHGQPICFEGVTVKVVPIETLVNGIEINGEAAILFGIHISPRTGEAKCNVTELAETIKTVLFDIRNCLGRIGQRQSRQRQPGYAAAFNAITEAISELNQGVFDRIINEAKSEATTPAPQVTEFTVHGDTKSDPSKKPANVIT